MVRFIAVIHIYFKSLHSLHHKDVPTAGEEPTKPRKIYELIVYAIDNMCWNRLANRTKPSLSLIEKKKYIKN